MAPSVLLTLAFAAAAWAAASANTCLTAGTNSRKIVPLGKWFAQQYHTVPYLPPYFKINSTGAALAEGYIFVATLPDGVQGKTDPAPVVVDDTGELVWVDPLVRAYNFHPQINQGSKILPYWAGLYSQKPSVGHGFGHITFLDDQYNEIKTICPNFNLTTVPPKPNCEFDLHESQLTDRGSVVATAYNIRKADLTSIGGPKNGFVFAGTVVEVDIKTEKLLFEWQSIDHVPVNETKIGIGRGGKSMSDPLDYFHINSVERVGENYLVSSRQTWSIFLVNPKGKILWQLQGDTGGDFGALPAHGTFHWQHHVRMVSQDANSMTISIFNNDNGSPLNKAKPSTGLTLRLPMPPKSAPVTVVKRVQHSPPLFVSAEGSYQEAIFNSTNQFMCYGFQGIVAEFGPTGTQLWSAQFSGGSNGHSYRGFKQLFDSTPKTAPTLVVNKGSTCNTAYVSWNGATAIDSWAVYIGPSASNLTEIGTVKKAGFETGFGVGGKCVGVTAIKGGKQIRSSNIVCN